MTDPVSVVIVAMRNRYSGGSPSVTVSTRFCRSMPVNDTEGRVIEDEPPAGVAEPVGAMLASHRVAEAPPPVAGSVSLRAPESPVAYEDEAVAYCSASILVSRTVEKNDGAYWLV